jgi:hypothetical protein
MLRRAALPLVILAISISTFAIVNARDQRGCGPRAVEKEKWRNLLLTKANRR